ncbi:MAG: hypothetical protein RLY59_611 [Actinomycetota bacterium]
MPTNDLAFGFLGLLVPLLAAFLAAWFIRPALLRALGTEVSFRWISLTVLGIALVAGNALRTGGIAALEFLIATALGMYARSGVSTAKQK